MRTISVRPKPLKTNTENTLANRRMSSRTGMTKKTCITPSNISDTTPLKYPATAPTAIPIIIVTRVAASPTYRSFLVPCIVSLKTSMPESSTPNGCLNDGGDPASPVYNDR